MAKVKLTADLIEAFAGMFLSPRYDDAKPTPQFHREAWALYASDEKQCCVIAPRDHAKSTGLTFDYMLAELLFRRSRYAILIGSTEDKAAEQLSNISEELETNEPLREQFGIRGFEAQTKTEIICVFDDGHRFRILARGAEQKIRGAMWGGMRPDLIVADDMEDDEQVENKDRRLKFRKWFFRAAKQALSKRGRIRVHGTILHDDSLLSRLRKNKVWKVLFYKAHKSYNDFSELLWPERWTAEDLRARQMEFEEDGDASGYSQEFLNTPTDNNERYLRQSDFIAMSEEDRKVPKLLACGVDFAVSKADAANRTSFTVGGKCDRNLFHHLDQHVNRWDSLEIVDKFFEIQDTHGDLTFYVEQGQIWLAIKPILDQEMLERDVSLDIVPLASMKDKAARGRTFQKAMRAGRCRFNKDTSWYQGYEQELLLFTAAADAKADDQFDSTTILHRGFAQLSGPLEEDDFVDDEELEERFLNRQAEMAEERSCTGY